MPADPVQERLQHLRDVLQETLTLLSQHGEGHWAAWLATCERDLAAYDTHGLDRLLGAFAGMGSFNDLLVLKVNGHRIELAQQTAVNRRIAQLRNEIWTEATALRHLIRQAGE
jgi:hypothetical protein